jgi:predicted P-loop ATPase
MAAGLPPWVDHLILNDQNAPRAILYNALIALSEDPAFKDAIRHDLFRTQTMLCAPVPWDLTPVVPRGWRDQDDREATAWLQHNGIMVREEIARAAVQTVAERNRYHPVMDYFHNIHWDGVDRLETWLTDYCGVANTPYVRAVGVRWMISGVARIYEPGCKADCVLILEGPEGIFKSTVFAVLGGPFYSNDIAAIGTKDAQEQILGIWIMELDELDAVTRARELASVKAFVSRSTDRFRFSYGRRVEAHPRQSIFGATTNLDTWHRDATGGRRWWPVRAGITGSIRIDELRRDRDQLLAEAKDRYLAGERWWLDTPELNEEARAEQEARLDQDPWEEPIIKHLEGLSDTSMSSIFDALNLPIDRRSTTEAKRVKAILKRWNWERKQVGTGRDRRWVYVRVG